MICTSCAEVAKTWLNPLVRCPGCITAWARDRAVIRDVGTERPCVGGMQVEVARQGTTTTNFRDSRESLAFSQTIRWEVPPALPTTRCWVLWAVCNQNPCLDTYLQEVGVWHNLTVLVTGFNIPGPGRDRLVTHLALALPTLSKKSSVAKQPMEPAVWLHVVAVGFDMENRLGLCNQPLFNVLTAGPLRPEACQGILVDHQVVQRAAGVLEVVFWPRSTIKTRRHQVHGDCPPCRLISCPRSTLLPPSCVGSTMTSELQHHNLVADCLQRTTFTGPV
jgi:hypothetical protein